MTYFAFLCEYSRELIFILVLSITISVGQKTSVSIKTAHAYYRDKGPLTLKIEKIFGESTTVAHVKNDFKRNMIAYVMMAKRMLPSPHIL